jgi:hypothetical protein
VNAAELHELTAAAVAEIQAAADAAALEAARVKYIGRNGLLPKIMEGLKAVPPAERRDYGLRANAFKNAVTEAVEARRPQLAGRRGGGRRGRLRPVAPRPLARARLAAPDLADHRAGDGDLPPASASAWPTGRTSRTSSTTSMR